MPQMLTFPKRDVPLHIACQIRSYQRMQWPQSFSSAGKIWDLSPAAQRGTVFVFMEDETLLSHVEVNQRPLELHGTRLNVYGISSVFTYPPQRGRGLAAQLVGAASEYIRGSDADVAMLFCGERVSSLYRRCGWKHITPPRIMFGPLHAPQEYRDVLMMLFVSPLGQRMLEALSSQPLHVGERTW